DIVATGLGSQVEVLLNPGTYLRLAENSEFVMVDNSLDNLLVRINKGSAIIEATGPDNLDLHVPIVTEQQRMTIVRAGIYRINATPGVTELFVRKGRVELNGNKKDLIKGGKKATFTSAGPTIVKLTSNDKDEFDDWSKTRGQTLARANQKLSARTVSGYLSRSWSFPDARFGRWGLWTWSPFSSCYTFLPFYYGWGSPYGNYYGAYAPFGRPGYYGNNIYNPPVITNSTPGGSGSGYPGGGSSGGSGGSRGGYGGSGGVISSPPSTPSQAGPRDPDSGSRMINTIKPPIN
ncbi:MAG: FecR family protein, partial [Pyrinomonadaceae bacterium]